VDTMTKTVYGVFVWKQAGHFEESNALSLHSKETLACREMLRLDPNDINLCVRPVQVAAETLTRD
jgi:hypothetical protein